MKPGKAGKLGTLPKPFKEDLMLTAAMSPFRGSAVGGLDIEKDIKGMIKSSNPAKIDPAAVEVLAVRSAIANTYGLHNPNDKAKTNAAEQKQWEKFAKESIDLSNEIATEAGEEARKPTKRNLRNC